MNILNTNVRIYDCFTTSRSLNNQRCHISDTSRHTIVTLLSHTHTAVTWLPHPDTLLSLCCHTQTHTHCFHIQTHYCHHTHTAVTRLSHPDTLLSRFCHTHTRHTYCCHTHIHTLLVRLLSHRPCNEAGNNR